MFFGPLLCVMAGISTLIVTACMAERIPEGATGVADSDMICVFYCPLHLILWVFVGVIALVFYRLRYRGAQISNENDGFRTVVGYSLGGMLLLAAGITSDGMGDTLVALGLSLVFNIVPAALLFGFGTLLTSKTRARHNARFAGDPS